MATTAIDDGSTITDIGAMDDSALRTTLVDKLKQDCSDASDYALDAANWQSSGNEGDATVYSLYGDGGTLSLALTPDGSGSAAVSIAKSDYETTNALLYYSGCSTLATNPDNAGASSGNSNSNSQASGSYQNVCLNVQVANPAFIANAGPGVMAMKGITPWVNQYQCSNLWLPSGTHAVQQCSYVQVANPEFDPYAGPGVMAMKGITAFVNQNQCRWVASN